ncbi:3'-5' exonuclease [uncultured Prevotella sp.]|uniref:3'-5' exonuclease n=1 Tax=uncultured Prevotella sp. TaxID=159272 RepID=UPI0025F85B4C|nr:3'-5' exonuclease [uncultured Prevotella sp.]
MKLNLNKPLVVFDLETTGLDLVKDRIIQISYIKVTPDGKEERGDHLINPECEILPIITQLTGISNEDVKDKPTFKQLAKTLAEKFMGCDFAGFNSNNFDIPLLAEEFLRAGIDFDFSKCRLIDACTIFRKMERRNLASAYKFYCGRKMEEDFEAHRADQDTEATYRVLMGQLDYYTEEKQRELGEDPEGRVLQNDMDCLAQFSKANNNVDFAGRIVWGEAKDAKGNTIVDAEGNPVMTEYFNFGKHKGKTVAEVLRFDPGYYAWILAGDFTYNTKQVLTRIRLREAQK